MSALYLYLLPPSLVSLLQDGRFYLGELALALESVAANGLRRSVIWWSICLAVGVWREACPCLGTEPWSLTVEESHPGRILTGREGIFYTCLKHLHLFLFLEEKIYKEHSYWIWI